MKPTEEIAVRLVGGAQSAYVQELSYFFLNLLDEVVRTNGAVIRGREIADFERLSRLSREEALAIYYKYRPAIDKQTREVLKNALKKTDDALVGQFVRAMGSRRHMTNLATIIAAQTAQGMNEVLERQNIALAKDQAALWYDVTAEAIARHQAGEPTRAVMERGVTRLANSGLETIDYISGTKTTIDAALRRHIVSQANQARNRLLMQRMDEWEWDLVFVDAHFGARPSHAEWQGKVYSRSGRSTEYPPLVESTGYGTVTGLCGANCYHYMTPYVPGYSELPDMDYSEQERITGMTSDEYYAATQKQRRYERLIRSQKREISYLQEVRVDAVKQRIRLGELQDKLRQFTHDNHLRRDYERERAWAVNKQPRALKTIGTEKGITNKKSANTNTKVDLSYITSSDFANKFIGISGDKNIDNLLYKCAVSMLTHRSGTNLEDSYLISSVSKTIIAKQVNSKTELAVDVNQSIKQAVLTSDQFTIYSIYNHPSNIPPSGADLAVAYKRKYKMGIVVLHTGDVYTYQAQGIPISKWYFAELVKGYTEKGYNEIQAHERALIEFSERFGLKWTKR